jgi:hypothetical protein
MSGHLDALGQAHRPPGAWLARQKPLRACVVAANKMIE